ncbi:MAG: PilZ domain-containing protein [Sedimentisphaerales bacterium]|nr:PilZ domain-containing protein [Sedimentisphaerales bacterium]
MFLHVPDNSQQRILHPATVIQVENELITAAMTEPDFQIEPESDVFVFHEILREFMQQSVRVAEFAPGEYEEPPQVKFVTTSLPVSAESRQYYRVCTLIAELMIQVGDETNCPLLDVSVMGLASIASQTHPVGRQLEIRIPFEDREFFGKASVMSIRPMRSGKTRYGFLCCDAKQGGGNLPQGLQYISTAVQRQQLRRLAGIA